MRSLSVRGIALISIVAACGAASLAACGGDSAADLFAGASADASAGAGGSDGGSSTGGKAGSGGAAGQGGSGGAQGGGAGKGGSGGAGAAGKAGGGAGGAGGSGGTGGAVGCGSSAECMQKLGNDACKTNIACDPVSSQCTWKPLDKDGDGHAPIVCGGGDCNDGDAAILPNAAELCDGKDNDCDGLTDNGATCDGLYACTNGACACPAVHACGGECVDKSSNPSHCGDCFHPCSSGASCVGGVCQCAAGSTMCGATCVNLATDPYNCGACGAACATGYTCTNKICQCTKTSCAGACVDTSTDPNHCGGCAVQCPSGSTCQSGVCVCGGGLQLCSGACVNTATDPMHCGGCNKPCSGACNNGTCVTCAGSDLYLLLDTSGSMAPPDGGITGKLDMARQGISAFLGQPASTGMGVGLGHFPKPASNLPTYCSTDTECGCGGTCFFQMCFVSGDSGELTDYSTATVPIALLPGNASAINNSMSSLTEGGGTPAVPLQGALQYAKGYAQGHPGHKVAVVLLADGLPNECTSNPGTATDWLPWVTQAATGTPPVLTYVISMGDSSTTSAFHSVASAGGTGAARLASSSTGVRLALEAIRAEFKTCP